MVELKMIIADEDKSYVQAIVNYLSSIEQQKFQVIAFTDRDLLEDYLATEACDLLLIHPDWLEESLPLSKVQVTVLLTVNNRLPHSLKDYEAVKKYQPGDMLAHELIQIFSNFFLRAYMLIENPVNNEKSCGH